MDEAGVGDGVDVGLGEDAAVGDGYPAGVSGGALVEIGRVRSPLLTWRMLRFVRVLFLFFFLDFLFLCL